MSHHYPTGHFHTIICAANPIKETLTASQCLQAIKSAVGTRTTFTGYLVSDGGDGFLEAISALQPTRQITAECTGPLGDIVTAPFHLNPDTKTAYIESAAVIGLRLVNPARRNLMMSGTAGLADLVATARNHGAKTIHIGLGGTATCDGGVGFLWQLACHAGQYHGCDHRVAIDLAECAPPDLQAIRNWLGDCTLIACVDVKNPLLGPTGAAHTFAPQKGATPAQVHQLEAWMTCWCERIERIVGVTIRDIEGAGAAGGLGFAISALGGEIMLGAQMIAQYANLQQSLNPGVLMITVEGRFDHTSFHGKAPWVLAEMAKSAGAAPVILCALAERSAALKASQHGVHILPYADRPGGTPLPLSADHMRETLAQFLDTLTFAPGPAQ